MRPKSGTVITSTVKAKCICCERKGKRLLIPWPRCDVCEDKGFCYYSLCYMPKITSHKSMVELYINDIPTNLNPEDKDNSGLTQRLYLCYDLVFDGGIRVSSHLDSIQFKLDKQTGIFTENNQC